MTTENDQRESPQGGIVDGLKVAEFSPVPLLRPFVPATAAGALAQTLDSGWLGEGPRVEEFETALARLIGNQNVVSLNSCTSALELAIRLTGLQQGDNVLSTPMTCAATNIPFARQGIGIRWIDVEPTTGNLDADRLEEAITPQTRAVVVVHWGGYPCDMEQICAIAHRHGLLVIEDAAHALGSTYRDIPIGNHGDLVCFSFQAVKMITTGDGGALVCRSDEMLERARLLRWYGIDRTSRDPARPWEYDILDPGYKFHMNDLAATLGIEGLQHVDRLLAHQRENARYYDAALADLPGLEVLRRDSDRESACWLYTVLADERDACIQALRSQGIDAAVIHKRNDWYSVFAGASSVGDLSGVDSFYSRLVCIPTGWWVTAEDRERVVDALRSGW